VLKQGPHNANRLCTLLPDVILELLWNLAVLSKGLQLQRSVQPLYQRVGDTLRAAGELIHSIADRRCVVRVLTPSPSLLCGTRRRRVRLAEIGKIRAYQTRIRRHPIAEGRVRDQRENHVHHIVAEAAAVEAGKAE
jgi:hypothetical protein